MAGLVKNGKKLYFIAKSLLEKDLKHYENEFLYNIYEKSIVFSIAISNVVHQWQ